MVINWPLIIVLVCLSIPGISLVMPRLIAFLLPDNSAEIKKKFSRLTMMQTLFMVFVLSFTGAILSARTGLNDPVLEGLLQGRVDFSILQSIALPIFLYAFLGLLVFCGLYYWIVGSILDQHNLDVMAKFRKAIGVDGCVLYGGVVEEIIARWGLMNLLAFFGILFAQQNNNAIIWMAIVFSGLIIAIGQIPAYVAAGCIASRRFAYSIVLLSVWQSLVFGLVFWQYGLLAAICSHMLFHIGWAMYDKP